MSLSTPNVQFEGSTFRTTVSANLPSIPTTKGPAGFANSAAIGTLPWTLGIPSSIVLPSAGGSSEYLIASTLGFAIPANATITGVSIAVAYTAGLHCHELSVRLSDSLGLSTEHATGALLPNPGTINYGGPTDLWGQALTPAIINAASFAAAIAVQKTVTIGNTPETVQATVTGVTVYYQPADNPNMFDGNFGTSPLWTPGAVLVDEFPVEAYLDAPWQINGWAISFTPMYKIPNASQFWARLSPFIGGLLVRSSLIQTNNNNLQASNGYPSTPFQPYAVLPPPVQNAYLDTIWDPNVNDLQPNSLTPQGPVINHQFQLTNPISLASGDQLCMGIWMPPIIASNFVSFLYSASYSVSYTRAS